MAFPSKPLTQLLGSNGTFPPSLLPRPPNIHLTLPRPSPRPNLLLLPINLHPNWLLRSQHPALQPVSPTPSSHHKPPRTPQTHTINPNLLRARLRNPRHRRLHRQRNIRQRRRRPLRLPVGCVNCANPPPIRRQPWTYSEDKLRVVCRTRRFCVSEWEL
jgi:hypothetical protein